MKNICLDSLAYIIFKMYAGDNGFLHVTIGCDDSNLIIGQNVTVISDEKAQETPRNFIMFLLIA